jgi:hypothetical protein
MVQAGIRKVYHFPAKDFEIDWFEYIKNQDQIHSPTTSPYKTIDEQVYEKKEINIKSVQRLVMNNPIAMTRYIPVWGDIRGVVFDQTDLKTWEINDEILKSSGYGKFYRDLAIQFETTVLALNMLKDHYSTVPKKINTDFDGELENVELFRHAMVLAHIASKRTDDAKVGVGAVLVQPDGSYGSVGWNGFPIKAGIYKVIRCVGLSSSWGG